MRLTDTFDDLLDSDLVEELRRRGTGVVRAARGAPAEAAGTASRRLIGAGLFVAGLAAGVGVGFVARKLATKVPEGYRPQPSYPVKDGVVDLTATASEDGIPASDTGVTLTGATD